MGFPMPCLNLFGQTFLLKQRYIILVAKQNLLLGGHHEVPDTTIYTSFLNGTIRAFETKPLQTTW